MVSITHNAIHLPVDSTASGIYPLVDLYLKRVIQQHFKPWSSHGLMVRKAGLGCRFAGFIW